MTARRMLRVNPPNLPVSNARNYGGRYNPKTHNFESRRINPDRPDGKYFPTDFDIEFVMGPPGEGPDWHPLLDKYGLDLLNQAGFVNGPRERDHQIGPGRLSHYHNDTPFEDINIIHPVFRRNMWNGITDDQYACLVPSILIASAVLDNPDTMRYFAPIVYNDYQVMNSPELGVYRRFTSRQTISEDEARDVYRHLSAMIFYTNFQFLDTKYMNGALAYTTPVIQGIGQRLQATEPDTAQSTIEITSGYLDILYRLKHRMEPDARNYVNGFQASHFIPPNKRIDISAENAGQRTILTLAITLLHEFTHAVVFAHFPNPSNPDFFVFLEQTGEPFYSDERCSEIGYSMTNMVFQGLPGTYTYIIPPLSDFFDMDEQVISAPYGFYGTNRWDMYENGKSGPTARTIGPPSNEPRFYYPIRAAWTTQFFHRNFWESNVKRFGCSAMYITRDPRWLIADSGPRPGSKGFWGTGNERWNDGQIDVDAFQEDMYVENMIATHGPHYEVQ